MSLPRQVRNCGKCDGENLETVEDGMELRAGQCPFNLLDAIFVQVYIVVFPGINYISV